MRFPRSALLLAMASLALALAGTAHAQLSAPARAADDGPAWVMATKDYANNRYSRLDQINTATAGRLKLAWKFDTGVRRGEEAAPIVVGDRMYVVSAYPNVLFAFDLARGGALLWKYAPPVLPAAQGVACCDVVNRGAAFHDGHLFFNTLDGQTVSVDAATGREVWRTRLAEINRGETMTMAPLVVKGKVLVGNSGGELGVRGWLTALDEKTGQKLWRAYSTGPDVDVRIGPSFHPHYASDRGQDLGVKSWPPGKWKIGGGTVWGFLAYDPVLDLVYHGTANPGPWNPAERPGDNKWTAGVFARRPDTGEAIWFYQWSPHDLHDHDGVNELVLVDMNVDGKLRRVLLHPDRNGYVYTLDRATGEVIKASPYHYMTAYDGVDLASGRIKPVAEKATSWGKVVRGICPAPAGAKDWQPSAFSPRTQLLYIPHNNLCADEEGLEANYVAGTPYVGANVRMYFGPGGNGGAFTAWDPVQGRSVFSIKDKFPVWSGALATAGDVVFYGTMDGRFRAVHARTGEKLWEQRLDSGVIGQPVTYLGPDGKQYVAILSGVGGWSGAVVAAGLDTRDESIALGFGNAMKDLPNHTRPGGTLYVFTLP